MDNAATGGSHTHLRIHAVNVYVRDQESSVRFFVDRLGFEVAFDARLQTGSRWVAVRPPDGTAVLALIEPKPDSKEYEFIGRITPVVFVTEDVLATYREWNRRGVQFLNTPRLRRVVYERSRRAPAAVEARPVWGGVFTRFRDPDGNVFSLVGFDEESRAVEEQRRAAAEKAESERRVAQELEIAKRVQARLFPQTLPPLQTLDYAGSCIQARQVGGDYYDFLNLGSERLGLVVGDIAGKGIAGALMMANLQANLRSQCAIACNAPAVFLHSVNQLFFDSTAEGAYATLFFAEYDDSARRMRYANCGHLSALLLRRNGHLDRLSSTATVLGLFRQWDCSIAECQLECGDMLAIYTDGITESFGERDEEFGEQRLIDGLRRHRDAPPAEVVGSIVGEVQRFSACEPHDDITLIIARCC